MKTLNMKNYYTLTDVHKKYGVPYMTLWRWKQDGNIPTIRLFKRDYIEEDVFKNIEKFLK